MTVLLGSTDVDLLRAVTFALESRGFAVVPAVPKREIAVQVTESRADILVLDAGFSQMETDRSVRDAFLKGSSRTVTVLTEINETSQEKGRELDEIIVELRKLNAAVAAER